MNLLINSTALCTAITGVGRCVYEIGQRLAAGCRPFTPYFFNGKMSRTLLMGDPFLVSGERTLARNLMRPVQTPLFWGRRALGLVRCCLGRFDLYWEPNHIPLGFIRARHTITTVHDLSVLLYPHWHPAKRREYFERHFFASTPRSDQIVTDSEFIRDQVIAECGLPSERVVAIRLGIDHQIFRPHPREESICIAAGHGIDRPFFLFVGSIEPRKNILGALKAYAMLPDRVKREHLFVLCGFSGWNNDDITAILEKEKEHIRYLGYVDLRQLAALYSLATAFVYPSFYEGFGLPPLEAMACGAPVIISDRASLPEVCGDAALYVDPDTPDSIADAMSRLVNSESLSQSLRERGLVRAACYQWDETTRRYVDLFTAVASR